MWNGLQQRQLQPKKSTHFWPGLPVKRPFPEASTSASPAFFLVTLLKAGVDCKVGPRPRSSLFSTCGVLFWENCYIILGANSSYPSCTCHRAPESNSCLTTIPSLVSDTKLNSDPLQSLKPRNIFQLLLVQRLSVPNRPCLQHRSLKGGHVWQFSHPPTDSTDSLWLPFGIPPGSLSRRPGLHIAPILLSCQLCTRVSHSQECLTCACAEVEPESLTPALKKN